MPLAESRPPEPWHSFLRDLDASLNEQIELYCMGGFLMKVQYHLERPTSDVDVLEIVPVAQTRAVLEMAGAQQLLHRQHGVYLQHIGIVTLPENSRSRAVELFPGCYSRLRVFGMDAYDLALSKLERNSQTDRDDIRYMYKTVPLRPETLERRYRTEQRPYLTNQDRHDLIMRLWLEMLRES